MSREGKIVELIPIYIVPYCYKLIGGILGLAII